MLGLFDEIKNLIKLIIKIFNWFTKLVNADKSDIKWFILLVFSFVFFTLSLTRVELHIYYDYHYKEKPESHITINAGILSYLPEYINLDKIKNGGLLIES